MRALLLALPLVLAGCVGRSLINDGQCSGSWPDEDRYVHCCAQHDVDYRLGGDIADRLAADQALRVCVLEATGDEALAEAGYRWVRRNGWWVWGAGNGGRNGPR